MGSQTKRNNVSGILQEIVANKRSEVQILKTQEPLETFVDNLDPGSGLDFKAAITASDNTNVIAELKRGSPSKGVLAEDFNPVVLADQYRAGGAAALSVLTERQYFHGHYEFLGLTKKRSGLPVLCKDFIIDRYQIYHAKKEQADAILLIVRLLPQRTLMTFLKIAKELGMDCLVETHGREEVRIALEAGAEIIGVNNRDLATFDVSLETCEELAELIPTDRVKVAESGIFNREHIERLQKSGYHTFLIGEALVTAENPTELLKSLRGV